MGPLTRGPTIYDEGDSLTDAASIAHVRRDRTLSDVSGAVKHDCRRLELDREMLWREVPLRQWFGSYMPGSDPTDISFPSFVVDLGTREQGMYSGLVRSSVFSTSYVLTSWTAGRPE